MIYGCLPNLGNCTESFILHRFYKVFMIYGCLPNLGNSTESFILQRFYKVFIIYGCLPNLGNCTGSFILHRFYNVFMIYGCLPNLRNCTESFILHRFYKVFPYQLSRLHQNIVLRMVFYVLQCRKTHSTFTEILMLFWYFRVHCAKIAPKVSLNNRFCKGLESIFSWRGVNYRMHVSLVVFI